MTNPTTEPALSPQVAQRTRGLRTGWTTGSCATAATKAALIGLLTGTIPSKVTIVLPRGSQATFAVDGAGPLPPTAQSATAAVVKDAGDDPDCTDGAHLVATVAWAEGHGRSEIASGDGVGTVTKPGLGLPIGAPAVNPVPRAMILGVLAALTERPVMVTLAVPGGEEMAERTSNQRLGILGGISILGTTGIVRPFSTAAYRASVVQQVDVAAAQGETTMVLCTGSRSEQAALVLYADLDAVCFVEVGDFSGIALRHCAATGITTVKVVAMAGKIAKLAAGVMMTHFHRSKVDTGLLAEVAAAAGAPAEVVLAATQTTTARHFFDACQAAGVRAPLDRLCQLARRNCIDHAGGKIGCDVVMVDFDGEEVVARA